MKKVIDFQMPSFKEQIVTDQRLSRLVFHEDYLELEQKFYAIENDDKLGVQHNDVYREYFNEMDRKFIQSIAAGNEPLGEENEYWYVFIISSGSSLKIYFKLESDQQDVLNFLRSWRRQK